jgi:hypothetical protein
VQAYNPPGQLNSANAQEFYSTQMNQLNGLAALCARAKKDSGCQGLRGKYLCAPSSRYDIKLLVKTPEA